MMRGAGCAKHNNLDTKASHFVGEGIHIMMTQNKNDTINSQENIFICTNLFYIIIHMANFADCEINTGIINVLLCFDA